MTDAEFLLHLRARYTESTRTCTPTKYEVRRGDKRPRIVIMNDHSNRLSILTVHHSPRTRRLRLDTLRARITEAEAVLAKRVSEKLLKS